ncbi:MAG: EFR1 family ferrodoxin [Oscillospiraceae bacterium]|nr:EFR1 family ferrodoxin [Oscillospiraceae bacterium]
MVLYFSGTGNSRYVAGILSKLCGDRLVSINRTMRERKLDPYNAAYSFQSDGPFVVVCPTYCWHIPRVVEAFLLDSRFVGSRQMYFLLTCGSGTGQAAAHAGQICRKLEMEFSGLASVRMPENYICLFRAPDADEAVGIIRAAKTQVETLSGQILSGKPIRDSNAGPAMPELLYRQFYRHFVHDRRFTVKDSCTGCGTCAGLCPLVNISMLHGRPVWGGNCTQCQACIAACPTDAIEFGRRSRGKRRYYLYASGLQKFPPEPSQPEHFRDN